jgi:hypothetical protein
MGVMRKYFLFFLTNSVNGSCYYIDDSGNIASGSMMDGGTDLSLPDAPSGWMDMTLSFGRNTRYWGINRTFTNQFKFVRSGAKIIRHLFYNNSVEIPISLIIFKWNPQTGIYTMYYKGILDLTKIDDQVSEGVTVSALEGGAIQMVKAFENTMVEIPMNGSIPQNIKVNDDGILFNDVFNYQIPNFQASYPGVAVLPCVFINNEGDNIGITKGSPSYEQPSGANWYQTSSNFVFSSLFPTSVRITGYISVKSSTAIHNTQFYLYTATSLTQPVGLGGTSHTAGLVKQAQPAGGEWEPVNSQVVIDGQKTFFYDVTINLVGGENLFILFFNNFAANPITILGGNFTLSFSSRYQASRVWGMKPYDVGNFLISALNTLSKSYNQPFNISFVSNLLQAYSRLVLTSGDALRASTDPNYYQYFNQATQNPANPNNQIYNQLATRGPVMKTSLGDFFDSFNALLNAALGNIYNADGTESLFIEAKSTVLNPSMDPNNGLMILDSAVSELRVSLAIDYYWNWLEIGYNPQQYDEKAGKYEYNSKFNFQAPIKTLQKIFSIICKYRADSYGIEYTRWNTSGGKSTTYNNSDNSVFILNTDFSKFIRDYFDAYFVSPIPLPTSPGNGDIKPQINQRYQSVPIASTDGDYFLSQSDYSIFMFNQTTIGSKSVAVSFQAVLNGIIGDSATIKMFYNGTVIRTWQKAVSAVNTPFNITEPSFNQTFSTGDNIYFTVTTVGTCTVQITSFSLNVGSGYLIAENSGEIDVPASLTQELISLPITTIQLDSNSLACVSTNFQYLKFVSNVSNPSFQYSFGVSAYHQGPSTASFTFDLWKNGVRFGTITVNGNANNLTWFNPPDPSPAPPLNIANGTPPLNILGLDTYNVNDIIWITVSLNNSLVLWITNVQMLFFSTSVIAYDLLRAAYDSVSGIPNPQTAYNIEDLTPARMRKANSSLLNSILFNLAPNQLTYQTADKNQFLATSKGGVTIQENANVDIGDLDPPLFYPLIFEFKTEVPINFSDLLTGYANKHIQFTYKNKLFYGFPIQVSSKPALNDSQDWKLLCSPVTNLSDLTDLEWDGIPILANMNAFIPYVNPVHFVPLNYQKAANINTMTMDETWFKNRITHWIDSNDFYAPWQTNDTIVLQCQSNGLAPVTAQLMTLVNGIPTNVGSSIPFTNVTDPAVQNPQKLYQASIPLTGLPEAIYYILWTMGTGGGMASFISEGLYVKTLWDNSLWFQYTNSFNKLGSVFSSGWNPGMRILGRIGWYTPDAKFVDYVNQPQDITLLNAIPYDTWKLEIGFDSGIPDYMMRKMDRIMLLDTVMIEGNQYSRNENAKWTPKTFEGEPKQYLTIDIRKAVNTEGITLDTSGNLTDQSAGYTIDAGAFGQNSNNGNLLQVTTD